jgi:hypothetical protein
MKNKQQIQTAPLNRAADLLAEKGSSFSDKTARQINAPFTPEIHMVGGPAGVDAIGELFRACGWLVMYHPAEDKSYGKHHSKVVKGSKRRLQPRSVCKPKGTRKRSKV